MLRATACLAVSLAIPCAVASDAASARPLATPVAPASAATDGPAPSAPPGHADGQESEPPSDSGQSHGAGEPQAAHDDEAVEAPAADEAEAPTASEERPRVHLFVDRRTEVHGYVVRETQDEIAIAWKDEVLVFPKARLLGIVRLVDPKPGQTGTVLLRNGQRRRGVILEDGFEAVVLEIEGIRTVVDRAEVDRVELEPTFEERLERYRAQISPDDHPRRLELARWLFEEKKYELARDELNAIVRVADLPEAERLLNVVQAQIAMSRQLAEAAGGGARRDGRQRPEAGERSAGPVDLKDMLPDRLLTQADVNLIRIYEMDMRDPPRLAVSPDTIRRLIEQHGSSSLIPASSDERTALFRAAPEDIVALMFRLRARDLYPEIEVLSEPPHLNLFRQRVHNAWLIPNCATSRCHGGIDGGAFFLHNRNYKDARVRYTNLLILDRLELDQGRLIDYDDPMMSLVIQHALPRTEARFPHPEVRGWRPVFTQGNRRLLEDSLRWIRAMYRPRPKYPVDYEPPRLLGREPSGAEEEDLGPMPR